MNDLPENELFSAYLDGELTAAEQTEVERLLARSPAARQLLDEFRTLSSTLQTLPQCKLGEDISQRVLRMAERRILTGGNQIPEPAETPWQSLWRRLFSPRALVWSAAAVVVAVTLTVINSDRRQRPADGRRVAMVDEDGDKSAPAAPAASIGPVRDSTEGLRKGVADAEHEVKPTEPAKSAERAEATKTAKAAGKKAAGGKYDDTSVMTKDAGRAGASKAQPAREAVPESAPPAYKVGAKLAAEVAAEKSMAGKAADVRVMEKPSAKKPAARPRADTPSTPTPAVAPPAAVAGPGRALKGGYRPKGKLGGGGIGGGVGDGGGDGTALQLTVNGRRGWGGQIAQAAGVVVLDCSPRAAQEKALDKVLADNGLAWDQTQVHAKGTGYVVATPRQIEAILTDLYAQQQNFVALSVQPAPGVEHWGRYSRAAEKQQQADNGVRSRRSDADRPAKSPVPADQPAEVVAQPRSGQVAKQPAATAPKPGKGFSRSELQQRPGGQGQGQGAGQAQEEPEGKSYFRQQGGEQRGGRKSEQKKEIDRARPPEQAPKYRVLFVVRVVSPNVSDIPSAAAAIQAADVPDANAAPAALMETQAKPAKPAGTPAVNAAPAAKK